MEPKSKSSASSRRAEPTAPSGDATRTRRVKRAVELGALPPLTPEQRAELAALAELPDDRIDASDAPVLRPEAWAEAVRGRFYKARKTSTTIRIDTDVLAWLRSQGSGYQTRLNAILRREMLAALKAR